MGSFGSEERRIRSLLEVGNTFVLSDGLYEIIFCGKPTCSKGEPKTDIYTVVENKSNNKRYEIKISFKKENADFLENKTNEERAEQLFGSNWSQIIINATSNIRDNFMSRPLIYKEKYRRTRRIFTPLPQSIVAITIHSIIRFMTATSMRYFAILEIVIASQISKMVI